jgi:hypothetical protein
MDTAGVDWGEVCRWSAGREPRRVDVKEAVDWVWVWAVRRVGLDGGYGAVGLMRDLRWGREEAISIQESEGKKDIKEKSKGSNAEGKNVHERLRSDVLNGRMQSGEGRRERKGVGNGKGRGGCRNKREATEELDRKFRGYRYCMKRQRTRAGYQRMARIREEKKKTGLGTPIKGQKGWKEYRKSVRPSHDQRKTKWGGWVTATR